MECAKITFRNTKREKCLRLTVHALVFVHRFGNILLLDTCFLLCGLVNTRRLCTSKMKYGIKFRAHYECIQAYFIWEHSHEIDYRCNFVSHLFHFQTSKCDVHIVIYTFFCIHSQVHKWFDRVRDWRTREFAVKSGTEERKRVDSWFFRSYLTVSVR